MCSSPSPPAPATSMSQTTIPEYAQPYVERMLGKAGMLAIRKFFGVVLLAIAVKIFASNVGGLIK